MIKNIKQNFVKTVFIELYSNNYSDCFKFSDPCSICNVEIVQAIEEKVFSEYSIDCGVIDEVNSYRYFPIEPDLNLYIDPVLLDFHCKSCRYELFHHKQELEYEKLIGGTSN